MRLTIKDKEIRDNFNAEYAKLADLEDIEDDLGIDLFTFYKNYKELLSLSGRNLRITIEEMKRELTKEELE